MKIAQIMADTLVRWYLTVALCAVFFKGQYGIDWQSAAALSLMNVAAVGPAVFAVLDGLRAWAEGSRK